MSHPISGHDYSEQHREESNKEYKGRRAKALRNKMNPTQRMTSRWLREAGKGMKERAQRKGESSLQHLKRLTK